MKNRGSRELVHPRRVLRWYSYSQDLAYSRVTSMVSVSIPFGKFLLNIFTIGILIQKKLKKHWSNILITKFEQFPFKFEQNPQIQPKSTFWLPKLASNCSDDHQTLCVGAGHEYYRLREFQRDPSTLTIFLTIFRLGGGLTPA